MSEVTFPQTAVTGSTQCVGVTLVDDSIVEDTEQFSAQVTSTSEITLIASPSTATYSIVDDVDSKLTTLGKHGAYSPILSLSLSLSLFVAAVTLSISEESYTVGEDSGVVQVCVQLTMGTMEGVSAIASLTIQPGTALESGKLANLAMYYNAYVLFLPSLSVCVCVCLSLSPPPSLSLLQLTMNHVNFS